MLTGAFPYRTSTILKRDPYTSSASLVARLVRAMVDLCLTPSCYDFFGPGNAKPISYGILVHTL